MFDCWYVVPLPKINLPFPERRRFRRDGLVLNDFELLAPNFGSAADSDEISEVWDLTLKGDEKSDVEEKYHGLTHGPLSVRDRTKGVFLTSPETGDFYELLVGPEDWSPHSKFLRTDMDDPLNYGSAYGLPEDCVMVVRVAALCDFEEAVCRAGETTKESPNQRKERLQKSCQEKKSKGVRAWKRETAREEGISTAMLDRILRRARASAKPKPGTIEALKDIGTTTTGPASQRATPVESLIW